MVMAMVMTMAMIMIMAMAMVMILIIKIQNNNTGFEGGWQNMMNFSCLKAVYEYTLKSIAEKIYYHCVQHSG